MDMKNRAASAALAALFGCLLLLSSHLSPVWQGGGMPAVAGKNDAIGAGTGDLAVIAADSLGYVPDLSKEYLVTQYADASGQQGTCYTIEGRGYFLVIDGGWAKNADALRDVILSHGGRVDAWIISHPHRDHAGAFNAIFKDPQGIEIGEVYDNGFDYDFIESVGEPYDDIAVMEEYHALTMGADNVTHLHRGDTLDICGLSISVLNAFDDVVLGAVGEEKDYQNNASLLFLAESENSRMLFCSDIKYDMDGVLLESAGDLISCDYVALGHHGNWSFSDEFYDRTGAGVFFMDAPPSISDNPEYPACQLKERLIQKGKAVLDFSTAPNSVTLR